MVQGKQKACTDVGKTTHSHIPRRGVGGGRRGHSTTAITANDGGDNNVIAKKKRAGNSIHQLSTSLLFSTMLELFHKQEPTMSLLLVLLLPIISAVGWSTMNVVYNLNLHAHVKRVDTIVQSTTFVRLNGTKKINIWKLMDGIAHGMMIPWRLGGFKLLFVAPF